MPQVGKFQKVEDTKNVEYFLEKYPFLGGKRKTYIEQKFPRAKAFHKLQILIVLCMHNAHFGFSFLHS